MKKAINLLCALFIIIGMIFLSVTLKEKEIIFPEVAALTIGIFISPKNHWITTNFKFIALLSLSALLGLCINLCITLPIFFKINLAFIITAILLNISKTTLTPIISACILPIFLNTKSFIYPISVLFISTIIILFKFVLEKINFLKPSKNLCNDINITDDSKLWIKRIFLFMIISTIPSFSKDFYFIIPPLIVIFIELTKTNNTLMNSPFKIILLISTAAISGTLAVLLGHVYLHLSIILCSLFAVLITIFCMHKLSLFLPPAGAIAVLPFILPVQKLLLYPFEVIIGIITFLLCSSICFSYAHVKYNYNIY